MLFSYYTQVYFLSSRELLRRNSEPLSQYVSDPPEKPITVVSEPVEASVRPLRTRPAHVHYSRVGFVTLFVLIGLSLLLFSGQILLSLTQTSPVNAAQQVVASPRSLSSVTATPAQSAPTPTPSVTVPFYAPNNAPMATLQLPTGHYVLYQEATHIYLVSTTDDSTQSLYTPGYTYSQAVRPLLTPDGKLVYTGDQGIWQTDLFDQQPVQLASLDADTAITSLALSQDGKMIAWTTEPVDATGQIDTYAGPLDNPQLLRQQSALKCPCLRIFSFLNGSGTTADNTLLLSDDRGSNSAVQYGLWSLDISTPSAEPQVILDENTQQGPLAFAPYSTTLLYAPYEGAVPVPTDGSVPTDVAALSYANSMSLETLDGSSLLPGASQVVLKSQKNQANSPLASWVTTPAFSPDGQTLAYVEFSTDTQAPYDRHSALYIVQITGSGDTLKVSRPQLVTISTARLFELGPWLNSHVITLYGDGAIYALDIQSGALTTLVQGGSNHYLRTLGTVGVGQT
jgi:hypothetical protein